MKEYTRGEWRAIDNADGYIEDIEELFAYMKNNEIKCFIDQLNKRIEELKERYCEQSVNI